MAKILDFNSKKVDKELKKIEDITGNTIRDRFSTLSEVIGEYNMWLEVYNNCDEEWDYDILEWLGNYLEELEIVLQEYEEREMDVWEAMQRGFDPDKFPSRSEYEDE
jgi:hypothetical protein